MLTSLYFLNLKLGGSNMNILSLDQALRITGYSILNQQGRLIDYGIIKTPNDTKKKKYTQEDKINIIIEEVEKLIEKHNIDFVVIEDIQKQVNIKTFKDLAILLGCLRQYLYNKGIDYEILSPSVWRSVLNIKGRVRADKKKNAQLYIKNKFDIDVSEDEADSISIACAMLHKLKLRGKIN